MQSTLTTHGPAAEEIARLWWVMLAMGAVVYVAVVVFLLMAIVRRRGDVGALRLGEEAADRHSAWIIGGAVTLSAVVLATVFFVTLRTQASLHSDAPLDLRVQIIARQWWWEIRYQSPSLGAEVVTANELHLPTGRRVRIEGTSPDVIHSLWVPNLQGKTDLIPGRTAVTWLEADQPGTYRGQCAEYCGIQHARMALLVIAQRPEEFARWLADQRRPAAVPSDSATLHGQSVFLTSGCGYCHAVRGARTLGLLAPDLTHFASRQTIAAATLTNTPGNLAGWIADPQHVKPGALMPRVPLPAKDLDAVVVYLRTLR